jgi:hypothetical protein
LSTKINSPVSVAVTPNGRADAIGASVTTTVVLSFCRSNSSCRFAIFKPLYNKLQLHRRAGISRTAERPADVSRRRFVQVCARSVLETGCNQFLVWQRTSHDESAQRQLRHMPFSLAGKRSGCFRRVMYVIQMPYSEFTIYKWEKRKENSGLLTARQTDFEAVLQEPRTTVPWIDLPSNCTLEPIDVNVEAGQAVSARAVVSREPCDDRSPFDVVE